MKKKTLGHSDIQVGCISLGAMSFAGFYGPTTRDESFACLDAAWDAGIDFLDTANVYGMGKSETVIGEYMRETGRKFVIATKASIVAGAPRGTADNSYDHFRREIEGSLTRLGVDKVALFYAHRRQFDMPIEEATENLAQLKQEGLIDGIGFSEIAPSTLRRASAVHPIMAVQNEYSLWTRYPDLGLIRTCAELGTTFVPFSPLARGMLVDDRPDPAAFAEKDFRKNNPRFLEPNFRYNCAALDAFSAFCRSRGWTTAAAAIAWTLDQGNHLIPIPGTRYADRLREWADADRIAFTDADRAEIDRLLPVGWAHGDRYSDAQIVGVERYC